MIKLTSIILAFVLYGQLSFNALRYYFQVMNPSWPIWIALYCTAVWIVVKTTHRIKLTVFTYDVYFFTFVGYVILSFAILGESDLQEFTFRISLICVAPYICGRILGKHVGFSLFKSLQIFVVLYLFLIVNEIVKNPSLFFETDRLRIFAFGGEQSDAGVGTAYLIGITLGSMWVAAFAYIIMPIKKARLAIKSNTTLIASVSILPLIILFVGSRSSIAVMLVCAGILVFFASIISPREGMRIWQKVLGFLLLALVMGLVMYDFLPEPRTVLLDEILSTLTSQSAGTGYDILAGNSIIARVALMSEAFRLFLGSPLFGIGASNFGLEYCGPKADFVSPHSLFAQVIVELGIAGAGLFILMILTIVRKLFRGMRSRLHSNHMTLWVLFSLWLFMLIQVQLTGNMYIDYHFYLLTGLLVSYLKYSASPLSLYRPGPIRSNLK